MEEEERWLKSVAVRALPKGSKQGGVRPKHLDKVRGAFFAPGVEPIEFVTPTGVAHFHLRQGAMA